MSHHLSKGERGQVLSPALQSRTDSPFLSPKQRQGWEKWLISTSAITWPRYAQGVTHLKKSESNLQQNNYIVKSPSFSVFWECSPRILIFLAFLFIWNDLMSLFSEKKISGSSRCSLHTFKAWPVLISFHIVPRVSCSLTECARPADVGRCGNSEKLVF